MASTLNPYLGFRTGAREALEFYASVFGGEPTISTFGEFGMEHAPDEADKVMHGQLETPAGYTLMASDTPADMEFDEGGSISVSLSGDDEGELTRYWDALSQSGTVLEPLTKAEWGDAFGMCVDRFGVRWMVNVSGAPAA